MTSTVRAVFFDLDNTLLDHSGAVRAALSAVYERYAELFEHLDLEELSARWNGINPRDSHHQSISQAAPSGAVARSVADLAALLGVGPDPSLIVV